MRRSSRAFSNEFGTDISVDVRSRQIQRADYSPTPDYYGPTPPEAVPGIFIRIEGRHRVNNRDLGTVSENHVTRLEAEKIYACLGVVLGGTEPSSQTPTQPAEPRADEGGVSQSQPIIGSVPLPTREAEEPAAFDLHARRSIYSLLASAWYYGRWKAETAAERAMQGIMEQQGWWPIQSEGALMTMIGRELCSVTPPLGSEPPCDEGNLPPAEPITQPSHDDEGLIERLKSVAGSVHINGAARVFNGTRSPTGKLIDQAANTISRLKGERDHADAYRERYKQQWSEAAIKGEEVLSRSLQLEAEIKELRSGLGSLLDMLDIESATAIRWNAQGGHHWVPNSGTSYAKARSLLSPSQDVELSSARSSRDARSSTRPEGPCSDEGGDGD